mmetsp:Transcript_18796/g.37437  ORF Transcript_18796/g.37437 Transcript_18796/m.37437 type:complete len:289 (+) Transcript_18796:99-965(+)
MAAATMGLAPDAAAEETATTDAAVTGNYETEELLNMYLGMHFPASGAGAVDPILAHDGAPLHGLRFPQRVARLLVELKPTATNGRALDVGCAVGGSSFELAATFDEVVGIDYSASFVAAATQMQQRATLSFRIPTEAELYETAVASHEPHVTDAQLQKCIFHTGDACALARDAPSLGTFDGVVAANLLCRLPDPVGFLDGLPAVTNRGGVVLLATPFSWLGEHTARDQWLGGYRGEDGADVRSKDVLKTLMEERGFEHIHEEQMPLVIREHQRKYQYIVSEVSGWRKL